MFKNTSKKCDFLFLFRVMRFKWTLHVFTVNRMDLLYQIECRKIKILTKEKIKNRKELNEVHLLLVVKI